MPLDAKERLKRKREIAAIGSLGLLFIVLTITEFRLGKISSTLPFVNSIFFFGLLNINIIILIVLVWLIFRNIGKVFIERRSRILGARLKTKLIIVFLSFSIIPTLALFMISALYINSSFDKWFSIKVQNTLQASLDVARTYYRNEEETAQHFADHLSKKILPRLNRSSRERFRDELESQRSLLSLDAVEVYDDPFLERIIAQEAPIPDLGVDYPTLPLELLEQAFKGETTSIIQHVGYGDLIRYLSPVRSGDGRISSVVAVNTYIPVSLINKVGEISSVFEDYKDSNPLKYPVKTAYLLILVMITLVILVVATWMGLYLARELTDPMERLVRGVQEVGKGNLDIAITSTGHDEIAVLVDSFNRMTRDLKENRAQLIQAGSDLERRTTQLEAILANVGTGVVVVDRGGVVNTFNRAIAQLLGLEALPVVGRDYREVLVDSCQPLQDLVTRTFADKTLPLIEQVTVRVGESTRVLTAVSSALKENEAGGSVWGVVVAVDDMTHLVKGQREMAWREVARRIAHEIKNPLTPIKLSAQRLQRRMVGFKGKDGALLKECTDTIIRHTDELKEMVNEFSSFARFPEVSLTPNDLNEAIGEVVSLYQQAHSGVNIRYQAEARLPVFEFDRDQMKRVLINLLDNAVTAVSNAVSGKAKFVLIETHFHKELQLAVVSVKDNGPGMSEAVRERIFEPYFSTKQEGTGLGLAIAKRIVNDHDGFIRVVSAPGEGTQFFIEIPTAPKSGTDRRESRFETA